MNEKAMNSSKNIMLESVAAECGCEVDETRQRLRKRYAKICMYVLCIYVGYYVCQS